MTNAPGFRPQLSRFRRFLLLMILWLVAGWVTAAPTTEAGKKGLPATATAPTRGGLEGIMASGALLGDTSGDGVADVIRARLVVPADGSGLLAVAAACERLGFESAGMDFDLVVDEARFQPGGDAFPVVIGRSNRWLPREVAAAVPEAVRALKSWAGVVRGRLNGSDALFILGSDPRAEAFAARSFFGRWPYLWEIWGRESGPTYDKLLADVAVFLKSGGTPPGALAVTAVYFEDKGQLDRRQLEAAELSREMKGWRWDTGEISRLCLSADLPAAATDEAEARCRDLLRRRAAGQGTETLNYPGVAVLELRLGAGGPLVEIPRFSEPVRFLNRRFQPEETPKFPRAVWLDDLYSLDGLLADGNNDRIPDDLPFQVVAAQADMSPALCHLAGRLALETTGARFPLVRLDTELPALPKAGPLLVAGSGGGVGEALRDLGLDLRPPADGTGVIRAFNGKPLACPQVWAGGATGAETAAAVMYLARFYPFLDAGRAEERSVPALREAVERWLAGREPAAAAASLLGEKAPLLKSLAAGPEIKVKGSAFLDRPAAADADGFSKYLRDRFSPAWEIRALSRQEPKAAFTIRQELPWEWDLVRELLKKYLAENPSEKDLSLDIRVSEPAAARARIREEAIALAALDAPGRVASVRVLSAFKQGFSWLADDISPRLKGKGAARVRIDFQARPPAAGEVRKVYEEPVRWLEELYPVDEILARDLGLKPDAVEFFQIPADSARPVYRVTATDGKGRTVLTEEFSPLCAERPFFQRFPSWGSAPVPRAGFIVRRGGAELARQAVDTDLDRVWQLYQAEVLPALEKHVMQLTGNHPTPDKQPFFQRLVADVTASEPDESLGFQREHVSALEAFHEDFYFMTLEYLNQLLDKSGTPEGDSVHYVRANPQGAPGTIVPFVRPGGYGKGPVAEFRLELPQSEAPQLEFTWTTPEGVEHPEKVKLAKLEPESVHCEAIYVRDGAAWGARFRAALKKDEDFDRFCRFFPVFRELAAAGMASPLAGFGLARLEFDVRSPGARGMFSLDFPDAKEAAKRRNGETASLEPRASSLASSNPQSAIRNPQSEEFTTKTQRAQRDPKVSGPQSEVRSPMSEVRTPHSALRTPEINHGPHEPHEKGSDPQSGIRNSQPEDSNPQSEIRNPQLDQSAIRNPQSAWNEGDTEKGISAVPKVTTDQIICPEECNKLLLQFQGLPGYRVFRDGTSYEGRPVYAAEVLAPSRSELVSRTKLLLRKPTLMLTGRQHANEVASTSYILKLMELLAADPDWQPYRQRVNFVLHPMENPDGAALACELQRLNPDHSLHAGRFSSLGVDLGYEVDRPDTLLTEAKVRNKLYGRWLPDIYLNLHGYPSHEWVQQFSGYTPYLFRQYWIPKGWFAYFKYDDSGLSPEYQQAGERLMDYIRRGMEGVPAIAAFDQDFYGRYRRWAVRWQPHIHYLDPVGETSLFHTRRSGTATRPGPRLQTTFAEGTPEVMDETERGEFLAFLSEQGLAYIRAHLDYLAASQPALVPIEEDKSNYTFFQLFRRRPPQAPEPASPAQSKPAEIRKGKTSSTPPGGSGQR
jgi:hypothetical protein